MFQFCNFISKFAFFQNKRSFKMWSPALSPIPNKIPKTIGKKRYFFNQLAFVFVSECGNNSFGGFDILLSCLFPVEGVKVGDSRFERCEVFRLAWGVVGAGKVMYFSCKRHRTTRSRFFSSTKSEGTKRWVSGTPIILHSWNWIHSKFKNRRWNFEQSKPRLLNKSGYVIYCLLCWDDFSVVVGCLNWTWANFIY